MSSPARTVPGDAQRVLLDVNVLAISLVADHPGYEYVRPELDAGVASSFEPLVFDAHPLRAQYIMTTDFQVDRVAARNSVQSLLRQPVRFVGASRDVLLDAYELSAELDHDVYDCFLLALGLDHGVDCLLTTDTDFNQLCGDVALTYVNPVPPTVLERFHGDGG